MLAIAHALTGEQPFQEDVVAPYGGKLRGGVPTVTPDMPPLLSLFTYASTVVATFAGMEKYAHLRAKLEEDSKAGNTEALLTCFQELLPVYAPITQYIPRANTAKGLGVVGAVEGSGSVAAQGVGGGGALPAAAAAAVPSPRTAAYTAGAAAAINGFMQHGAIAVEGLLQGTVSAITADPSLSPNSKARVIGTVLGAARAQAGGGGGGGGEGEGAAQVGKLAIPTTKNVGWWGIIDLWHGHLNIPGSTVAYPPLRLFRLNKRWDWESPSEKQKFSMHSTFVAELLRLCPTVAERQLLASLPSTPGRDGLIVGLVQKIQEVHSPLADPSDPLYRLLCMPQARNPRFEVLSKDPVMQARQEIVRELRVVTLMKPSMGGGGGGGGGAV